MPLKLPDIMGSFGISIITWKNLFLNYLKNIHELIIYYEKNIFNTLDSKTREEALQKIINNMNESLYYKPLAYMLEQSNCSCCRSEYFYLIYKNMDNEVKTLCYSANIFHANTCAIIRCTCNKPFTWKNINPIEKYFTERELTYVFDYFTGLDESWVEDYCFYEKQKKENEEIYKYNEDADENDETNNFIKKNYLFYFN